MRIIIAIDIMDGRCVRLTKGDYETSRVYCNDPLETAFRIEDAGLEYLHLVDLDGARSKRVVNLDVLEKIAGNTGLQIDFSGGIRAETDIASAFSAGAHQVVCGSVAVTQKEMFLGWVSKFGPEKIILGADSRNRLVSTSGWFENSGIDIADFIKVYCESGIRYAVCTDIDRDGMLQGPSTALYREILAESRVNLIASGGISTLQDIEDLRDAGCEGAIIGKAFYEGKITLEELRKSC